MKKNIERLTDERYWNDGYRRRNHRSDLPNPNDFREFPLRRILETIESIGLAGKAVLEVGAGDSTELLMLARRWKNRAHWTGLDYTEAGCKSLRERADQHDLPIEIRQADLFQPPLDMVEKYDVVYSIGLVEHFDDLASVLASLARFLKPNGIMVSIIPNMHGILGQLTRRWNRVVYDIHNPHDLRSFLSGHVEAKLTVTQSGYLCSTNFGVLSSCFTGERSRESQAYLWLSRFSKFIWLLESKIVEFPSSSWLSPYIFAISHRSTEK